MNTMNDKELIEEFLKKIPQLKEYVLEIDSDEYHKLDDKSYVYEWTNLKNLKVYEETGEKLEIFYIGYNSKKQCLPHEDFDIPYFHTTEYKKFRDDLSDPNGEWKLRIRSVGKADVMQCEEWLILLAADGGIGAVKSEFYYNRHNGGIMKKNEKLDIVKCDAIIKQLKEGVFPINEVDKETHRDLEDFQPRDQTYPEWIIEIRDEINAIGGNITYTDPTITFEGLGENGKDKDGGGIHTKHSVLDSKATKMKEQRIPYEIGKTLTSSEIRYICNQFNARPRKRSKYINLETGVKEIVDGYIDDRIEPDDPIWPTIMKKHGFIKVGEIIKDATAEVKDIKYDEKNAKSGKVRKRYDKSRKHGGHKEELDEKIDAIHNPINPKTGEKTTSTTLAYGFSIGNPKNVAVQILELILERNDNGIKTEKIIYFPYPTKASQKITWGAKQIKLEKQFDYIFRETRNIEVVDETLAEFEYHSVSNTKTKNNTKIKLAA